MFESLPVTYPPQICMCTPPHPPTPQDGKTHWTELTVALMQLAQVGKKTVETRYPQLIFPPTILKQSDS